MKPPVVGYTHILEGSAPQTRHTYRQSSSLPTGGIPLILSREEYRTGSLLEDIRSQIHSGWILLVIPPARPRSLVRCRHSSPTLAK